MILTQGSISLYVNGNVNLNNIVMAKGCVKCGGATYKKGGSTKKPKLGSGERFKALSKKIQSGGKSKDAADAIAAAIGRKKYGNSKFQKMAATGKK